MALKTVSFLSSTSKPAIIMLLLNHELEGDFIRHSYTTTMMIVVFISIFLHNYYDDFDLQFELYCAFVIQ